PLYVINSGWVYLTWVVPAAVVGLMALAPCRRIWWAGLAMFVAAMAPVLGLVSFGFQGHSTVADRYAYLGMLGIAMLLAWWTARHWRPLWLTIAGMSLFAL